MSHYGIWQLPFCQTSLSIVHQLSKRVACFNQDCNTACAIDEAETSSMQWWTNMSGENQFAAAQLSWTQTSLNKAQDVATPQVECAHRPLGGSELPHKYAKGIAATTQWDRCCLVTRFPLCGWAQKTNNWSLLLKPFVLSRYVCTAWTGHKT